MRIGVTGASGMVGINVCKEVLKNPRNEYTQHLLSCIPDWLEHHE